METDARILPPNFSIIHKIQSVDGYDPLYLQRYGELMAAIGRGKPDISSPFGFNRIITPQNYNSPLIDLLGVKYILTFEEIKEDGFEKSVNTLVNEVDRCGKLGIPYLVTHLGSHLGTGEEAGIKQLVKGLNKAGQTKNDVMILLENTAGQKNSVGANFEQLAEIFNQLKPAKKFGICFDTCHAFVSGYDLRTEKLVKDTLAKFDDTVGFENLKILHLNDAKGEIGCNLDRHYHIGLGNIGEKGLSEVIKTANKKKIPIILETPIDNVMDDFENIRKVKELA